MHGVLMGSSLSPIVANIVLEDLETEVLKKLSTNPTFYV